MAKGQRGRQGGRSPSGGGAWQETALPGRRGKKRSRPAASEMPTAAPSSANVPALGSIFGSTPASAPAQMVGRPRPRAAGGPRSQSERRITRRAAVMHDFRYVGADLRWIALTTGACGGLVAAFWAALRF